MRSRGIQGIPDRVGAVIVAHDKVVLAQRCVTALARELDPRDIVVVVNRPGAAPADEIETLERSAGTVVLNREELGYGANLNRGIGKLPEKTTLLLLMNDDVVPHEGSVAALVECMRAHHDVGLVAPQLMDTDGNIQSIGRRFPSVSSEVHEASVVPLRRGKGHPLVLPLGRTSEADWVVGAVLLVRARAFSEIGGFDESFFLYWEEVDLAFRLRQSGWRTRVCSGAVMEHLEGASTPGTAFQRMLVDSRRHFIDKHWGAGRRTALVVALAIVQVWNGLYIALRVASQSFPSRAKRQGDGE